LRKGAKPCTIGTQGTRRLPALRKERDLSKTPFFALFAAAALAIPCAALAGEPAAAEQYLQAAIGRAQAYREKAALFDGAGYFPSEMAGAIEMHESAGAELGTSGDAAAAAAAFGAAADAFAAIFRLSASLYAQAREDEIMMARDRVTAGGGRAIFPALAAPADRRALEALAKYEAGDYIGAREAAAQAYAKFQFLEAALGAWLIRREIVLRGFAEHSRDNYDLAEKLLAGAAQAYLAQDLALALEDATEAHARFSLALSAGWAAAAEHHAALAQEERLSAVEARAHIASGDLFGEADSAYRAALDLLRREYFAEAATQFADAEALYFAAKISTFERRRIAAAAISEAKRRIDESIEAARRAARSAN